MMSDQSKVLVVDDQVENRELLVDILEDDYQVETAANGRDAIAMAASMVPDLILLDVMMPDLNGYEVCKRLRDDSKLGDIPIIMLTALDSTTDRINGLNAGADDFVSKPFDYYELRARVRTITKLNRYRRLVAERKRFTWVVESSPDGYLVLDSKQQIEYINPRACVFLGAGESQDVVSKPFIDVIGDRYQLRPEELWERFLTENPEMPKVEQKSLFLVQPETASTNAQWLQVEIFHLPDESTRGFLVRMRDVTRNKLVEIDSKRFHTIISHKLRTPLVPLIGGLELLTDPNERIDDADAREMIRAALDGARRLYHQVEDILTYSQAAVSGLGDTQFDLDNLPSLVAELSANLKLSNVRISGMDNCPNVTTRLSSYAAEIILLELLENSKKFHPSNSPQVDLFCQLGETGRSLSLKVQDDGVSLENDQLIQVWAPYYQIDRDFTGQVAGMGLGLPLVASMVWLVGGRCQMRNRADGPGVVVELWIPVA